MALTGFRTNPHRLLPGFLYEDVHVKSEIDRAVIRVYLHWRKGMGGEEEGSESELHSIPSVSSLPHPVLIVRGWGDGGSRGNGMGEEKRREDTSVGMDEHSSQQSLSCLLPQHTHTPPYPVLL